MAIVRTRPRRTARKRKIFRLSMSMRRKCRVATIKNSATIPATGHPITIPLQPNLICRSRTSHSRMQPPTHTGSGNGFLSKRNGKRLPAGPMAVSILGETPWTDAPTSIQPVVSSQNRASPYGAYNMAGNVAEWTTDRFPAGPAEIADMTRTLGTAKFSPRFRVIKGGWFSFR